MKISEQHKLLCWLDGIFDAVSHDDNLKAGGDHQNFVRMPRTTYNMIREAVKKSVETDEER